MLYYINWALCISLVLYSLDMTDSDCLVASEIFQ